MAAEGDRNGEITDNFCIKQGWVAPNGVPFLYPVLPKHCPKQDARQTTIYRPKISFFADAWAAYVISDPGEVRSEWDFYHDIGRVPKGYCSDWNAGRCTRPICTKMHICEWCASPDHRGNRCPWHAPVNARNPAWSEQRKRRK